MNDMDIFWVDLMKKQLITSKMHGYMLYAPAFGFYMLFVHIYEYQI